ncbi:MAG: 2-keto-4-pentenoate hydratase [Pseudomonadota bacterium]
MNTEAAKTARAETVREARIAHISDTIIGARKSRTILPAFPGDLPADLDEAYRVQERSIGLWDSDVVAWKVGGIPPHLRPVLGQDWVTGPIYRNRQKFAGAEPVQMPVYDGGFAAVEAEIILEFGNTEALVPSEINPQNVAEFISTCYIGVEIASSPMPDINVIGSLAVISDFGNNNGMIVGREIDNWSPETLSQIDVQTFIDGASVGAARPPAPPAGPMGAAAFLVQNLALRGRPIASGLRVSSGALTGIHDVTIGQRSKIVFGAIGEIDIEITAMVD